VANLGERHKVELRETRRQLEEKMRDYQVEAVSIMFFLAYFVANIWSYSQLKILYFFPNPQKKIPS
jgi:hypothetical protein